MQSECTCTCFIESNKAYISIFFIEKPYSFIVMLYSKVEIKIARQLLMNTFDLTVPEHKINPNLIKT